MNAFQTGGLVLCVTGVMLAPVVAASEASDTNPVQSSIPDANPLDDQTFVTAVAESDLLEMAAAEIALRRSKDAAVREFARRLKVDHTATSKELKMIATAYKLHVATKVRAEHAGKLRDLRTASAGQFDGAYRDAMVSEHQAAVQLFSEASQSATLSAELRDFATRTLPTLQAHLNMADDGPEVARQPALPPDYQAGASATASLGEPADFSGGGPEVR